MEKTQTEWTGHRVELIIGNILRVGVLLAAAVVLLGGALYLAHHGTALPNYRTFRGEPPNLRFLSGIVKDALALHGRGIIQLGLLLLIATPVTRVAFSVIAFALERDHVYIAVTLVVLAVLVYGFLGGQV